MTYYTTFEFSWDYYNSKASKKERWLFLDLLYQDHTKEGFDVYKSLDIIQQHLPEGVTDSKNSLEIFRDFMLLGNDIFNIRTRNKLAFALSLTNIIYDTKRDSLEYEKMKKLYYIYYDFFYTYLEDLCHKFFDEYFEYQKGYMKFNMSSKYNMNYFAFFYRNIAFFSRNPKDLIFRKLTSSELHELHKEKISKSLYFYQKKYSKGILHVKFYYNKYVPRNYSYLICWFTIKCTIFDPNNIYNPNISMFSLKKKIEDSKLIKTPLSIKYAQDYFTADIFNAKFLDDFNKLKDVWNNPNYAYLTNNFQDSFFTLQIPDEHPFIFIDPRTRQLCLHLKDAHLLHIRDPYY